MRSEGKTCDDVEPGYEIILKIDILDLVNIISFDKEVVLYPINSFVEIEVNFLTKIL